MNPHLSDSQIDALRRRALTPAEMLALDDHLAGCVECRSRVSAFLRGPFSWFPIPVAGAAVVTALILWIHTLSLRTEIRDLTSQISSLEQSDAALRAEQEAARQKVANLESFIKKLGVNGSEPAAWPSPPAPGIVLNDGGSSVTLDAQGSLSGLERLAPPVRDAVQSALARQRAETPGLLKDLIGRQGTLLSGSGETGPRFNLARPVGTVALTDRPKFSWMPLAGASSYAVSVYDANFNLAATSGPLTSTSWIPEKPLPRGAQLSWQVRALRGSEAIIAPAPPSPEARFIILPRGEAGRLQDTLVPVAGSHLARGMIYAKAGALDEAESEFRALLAANPKSPIARRLLYSLLKLRHP